MLTLYYGNDTIGVRTKALEKARVLEEGGTSINRVTGEDYATGMVSEKAAEASLFSLPQATLLDTLSENNEAFDELLQCAADLVKSPNTFICVEGNISAEHKKIFTKAGAECIETNGGAKNTFNVFQISDALAARDKRTLWFLIQAAKREGIESENIIGTLFWQLKILRLAEKTKTPEEAGQKPFPYNKAKRALAKFKEGELETLSESLLSVYHNGHNGSRDIQIALERWVLEL